MAGELKKHVHEVLDGNEDTPALRASLLDKIREKNATYTMDQLTTYMAQRWVRLTFEIAYCAKFLHRKTGPKTIAAGASSSAMRSSAPEPRPRTSSARKINPNGPERPDYEVLEKEWEAYKIKHGKFVPLSDGNCKAIVQSLADRRGKTSGLYEGWVRRYFGTKIKRSVTYPLSITSPG